MPFLTIGQNGDDLTFQIPTKRTRNWADQMRTAFFDILSQHGHTGSGDGKQISTSSIADSSINGTKIRLDNDEWLRARNATNTADVNILKVNSGNLVEINGAIIPTIQGTDITISNDAH